MPMAHDDSPRPDRIFEEIERPYTAQEAVAEANRCIKCQDAPCNRGCPAGIDVARFIRQIANRNFGGAIRVIREDNVLPGSCARICPQEILCEGKCSSTELAEAIHIGKLQRFAADYEREKGAKLPAKREPTGVSVAVVGAGPAGLSAAATLARLGYDVDLFEGRPLAGGLLTYAIPPFRLPYEIVRDEIEYIEALGVKIYNNSLIEDLPPLLERYGAVFLGLGSAESKSLAVEGEDLHGVFQGLDLLREIKLAQIENRAVRFRLGPRVEVIGGGDTAVDAAASARLLGVPHVTLRYRRTAMEMPARPGEVERAQRQGVKLELLCAPVRFIGQEGTLRAVEYVRLKLGEEDRSGRPRPVPIEGSNFVVETDTAIIAVGQTPRQGGLQGLERDRRGRIRVDEDTMATSIEGVYSGGDAVNGGDTAVRAVGDGKRAAFAMDEYVRAGKRTMGNQKPG
ncbi:MAG: NAD(P)-dependent oxidoreductase [Deltaproteobacteria bacterium]|nr:NAD(P)-dependent oxidoreductase [Deltaproteobacteria bacterium]